MERSPCICACFPDRNIGGRSGSRECRRLESMIRRRRTREGDHSLPDSGNRSMPEAMVRTGKESHRRGRQGPRPASSRPCAIGLLRDRNPAGIGGLESSFFPPPHDSASLPDEIRELALDAPIPAQLPRRAGNLRNFVKTTMNHKMKSKDIPRRTSDDEKGFSSHSK